MTFVVSEDDNQQRLRFDARVSALPNLEARSYRNEQLNQRLRSGSHSTGKGAVTSEHKSNAASGASRRCREMSRMRSAGTMIVQRHGRIIFEHAAGLADREARIPVTMDTRFRLGSANKMFTAVGILQLVEQGKIALDSPISAYLPNFGFRAVKRVNDGCRRVGMRNV